MCFSAAASLAAGGTLSVVGGLTLAKVKNKSELPFASIPLLFGIQQAIEGAVWLSFGSPVLNTIATLRIRCSLTCCGRYLSRSRF